MDAATKIPLSHKRKKPGSETRQKTRTIGVRMTADEYAQAETLADGSGLTLASYIRLLVVKQPHTRSRRRPSVEVQTLASLLAQLGKIGSNLNQLARFYNYGENPVASDILSSAEECRKAAGAIMETLGRGQE